MHSVEKLFAAIDSQNSTAIRNSARSVLRSAFDHLFYDVTKPADGDGTAMSTLMVSAGALDNHAAR
ncbi:MAG TPA: hypothetical protein VMV59_00860 [Candidatus Dormibacteraeota bacterium]|nr:hypothetical protein [Candidatus Dormibacteraeota bacterium]